ncbi:ACP phosphodiesterase [Termitidicoccus mucosus]|uniref:ACP phosphodiesterase n=1 Tax=Termitidicoccus mucosus TaxID=1184151 RepID=UPI000839267F
MNWLAHLHLSKPAPAFRIGSLLPDFTTPACIAALPEEFQRGAECHRRIDAFTDAHPVVRRSMARVGPHYRRFAGVLVDVFYDHILARDWASHAGIPLPAFAAEIYDGFRSQRTLLPDDLNARFDLMIEHDWLCGYRELAGIRAALARLSSRLRRPFDLAAATDILAQNHEAFRSDFNTYFPQLRAHVAAFMGGVCGDSAPKNGMDQGSGLASARSAGILPAVETKGAKRR